MDNRIILGIDPGTTIMGYAVIKAVGNKAELLVMGFLELQKIDDQFDKLKRIFERTIQLIESYQTTELAIEAQFFGKNVQSMLKLGRAQGVAICAALSKGLPVTEYAPRKIKMAITGQGNASKEQVAFLLQKILNINELPENLDATDGLAVAMCHFYQKNTPDGGKSFKSWNDFISKNPGKVK